MRVSQIYAPTLREIPAEAEIASHQLLMKSGMIRKVAGGLYTYLPLGWRTMKKIMAIIREEMDAIDGQEIAMPAVQPAELWLESGRWRVYGAEMWRVKDRHDRDFCLAPTHEEVVTFHIRNDVRSYRSLPLRPYQIQNKYRDERRPRFGLMRSREFLMKDMYSFDVDEAGLDVSYKLAYDAYSNIFRRCGLNFRPVEADSGAIGGSGSHEFMALADCGESQILYCSGCDFAATDEFASIKPVGTGTGEELREVETVYTPDCKTMEEVSAFLNVPINRTVKSMVYKADDEIVLVLIRGDRQINEVKLANLLDVVELGFAEEDEVRKVGLEPGYCGPVGTKGVRIIADEEIPLMINHECGQGQKDHHLLNVNYGRDYTADIVADIKLVEAGDACPCCGAPLLTARGIEVGQVFKLHTKYSSAMGARYVDANGEEHDMVMGCYGIGVGRTMSAVIEQNHDDKGIIWPMSVAPYQVLVVPVNDKDAELCAMAEDLYQELKRRRVEVLIDDRAERPGVKFNDADLWGIPLRVIFGKKCRETGKAELKFRADGRVEEVEVSQLADVIEANIRRMLDELK